MKRIYSQSFKILLIFGLVSLIAFYSFTLNSRCVSKTAFKYYTSDEETPKKSNEEDYEIIDFEGFNNITGADRYIIPNIFHLLHLQSTKLRFYQMINIFAIYLNHKPDYIYVHCDNCSFEGKYWDVVRSYSDLWSIIRIKQLPFKDTVFGVKYGWINHHRSDVYRLLVLMNYGGIYVDSDTYVITSLDKYRKYEMVVSWDHPGQAIGVMVLIAHKNARLLKAHYDSYRYNYTPWWWYWNAGWMPAKILIKHPYMAHTVVDRLGTHMLVHKLYKSYYPEWKTNYECMHLLINHRGYLDKESPIKEFNETNIIDYNATYGYMVRDIIERAKIF